jgi:hypothetical protein
LSKKAEPKGSPAENIVRLLNDAMNQFNALETQLKKRCKRIEDRLVKINKRIEKLEVK